MKAGITTDVNQGMKNATIYIYDVIGQDFFGDGLTARSLQEELNQHRSIETIDVRINSPGGSVFDGIAIYNMLADHPATVNVWIDGAAWSMASGIAMAGDTVNMAENALLMLHDPMSVAVGNESDMRSEADRLSKVKDQLTFAYKNKSGKPFEEISSLMSQETWMSAEEAKDFGFVDNITSHVEVKNKIDIPEFIRVPGNRMFAAMNVCVPKVKKLQPDKEPEMSQEDLLKGAIDKVIAASTEPGEEQKPKPQDRAATIDELSNLEGADSEFVVTHLRQGSTITQALNDLNKSLLAKISKFQAPENEEGDTDRASKTPVGNSTALQTNTPSVQPFNDEDPYASMSLKEKQHELRRLVEEKRGELGNRFNHSQVLNQLSKTHKELFGESHLQPYS